MKTKILDSLGQHGKDQHEAARVRKDSTVESQTSDNSQLNILILYDDHSTHINTVCEHLASWAVFSRHKIYYSVATHGAPCDFDLSLFDVVIIHYSVRISFGWHLSPDYAAALQKCDSFTILFIQDEYDMPEIARKWINTLNIQVVFTCVPEEHIEAVYPPGRFPRTTFAQTLTGYIPIGFEKSRPTKPMSKRKYVLGYRGRELAYWYGDLAREKILIGTKMKKICEDRGVLASIEWEEEKRIYGKAWYGFLEDCRAVLGTESGSNIFDGRGNIRKKIQKALKKNPASSYEEIHKQFLAEHEGQIRMNQISPKVFEAVVAKTALVLFEGEYSGVVKPDLHFIPLKKDFSNVDQVLEKLEDLNYLEELTERAFKDVILSEKFSYKTFIQEADEFISRQVPQNKGTLSRLFAKNVGRSKETVVNLLRIKGELKEIKKQLTRKMRSPEPSPSKGLVVLAKVAAYGRRKLKPYPALYALGRTLYPSVRSSFNMVAVLHHWVTRMSRKKD